MSRIFLSHSSVNNGAAVALRDWLAGQGWNDVFLDLDPGRGIAAGERWERALNEAASQCEAVLFLVSRVWLESRWCQKELMLAHKLNKRMFGVLIETIDPGELPRDLAGTWQFVDLASGRDHQLFRVTLPRTHEECHVTFSCEGLTRLRNGLVKAGLDPRFFDWPPETDPNRPPYRGLRPIEAEDAGIFFGRDAPIVEALDQLRGLREASSPRLLVVLGASGAGKSSFLRAGLFARMARYDRDFLPLPIIRPERAAISGENGFLRAVHEAIRAAGLSVPRTQLCAAIDDDVPALRTLLQALVDKRTPKPGDETLPKPPTLVIAIDQGEELFRAEGRDESESLLALLRTLLADDWPALIVVFAMRSDSYAQLQEAPSLEGIRKIPFDLGPMPKGSYAEVIKGPANRLEESPRPLKIEEALVGVLLKEIEAGGAKDALPLLSFTLERLYLENLGSGHLTVADYERLGGIKGSIEEAVERALSMADTDPSIPKDRAARLALLRRGVIPWLAGIDPDSGAPRRRIARLSEIPVECRGLLQNLVEQRLLTTDDVAQSGDITIEPAHEALLRQWTLLEGWLADDAGLLAVLEGVKRASRDWTQSGRSAGWLTHSADRLIAAERLGQRPDLAANLEPSESEYLKACREVESERIAALERHRQAELRAAKDRQEAAEKLAAAQIAAKEEAEARANEAQAHSVVLRKRSRILRIVVVVTLAIAAAAVAGFVVANNARHQADARTREAVALRLASQGLAMLAGVQGGGDMRAIQQILAAPLVASTADTGALFNALVARQDTLKLIRTPAAVRSMAVSPDGHRIVSGSQDNMLWMWDADSGQPIGEPLTGHTGPVDSVAFSPDGHRVVSGSQDNTLRIWNADTGQPIGRPLRGHTNWVNSVAFSPDGHRIVSGSSDQTVRLWNADTGQPIGGPLASHTNWVNSVAFSPDGRRIASASDDRSVRIWNADTGQPIGPALLGHTNWVTGVAFSPDGRRLVSCSWDNTVRLWDADTGQPIGGPLIGHTSVVESVAFSPDGHSIASGGQDDTVRVWNADTRQPIGAPLTGHTSKIYKVAFTPDGRIVSASLDHTVRVWDAGTAPLTGHTGRVAAVEFSPDGHRIASGGDDNTVRLWNADTDQPIGQPLTGHTGPVAGLAFSPDGHRIVSGSYDNTLRLWNADTGQPIGQPLTGHTNEVFGVAFSPDGHRIVSGSYDNTVRLWNADTGQPIGQPLTGHTDLVAAVAFSPHGHRIISASYDHTLRLWNADTGQPIGQPLTGHTDEVFSAAFSPDGHRIVSGSADDTLRLWNADTGEPVGAPLNGHAGTVTGVAFSPDGRRIISGSADKTLRLWDADTGRPIGQPLTGHTASVASVAFSPDGQRAVSGAEDFSVRLWPVPPQSAWRAVLCKKLTVNMSHHQWNEWVAPSIDYIPACPDLPVPPDNAA